MSKTVLQSLSIYVLLPAFLSGCQLPRSGVQMEPASAELSERMHPQIRTEFEKDYIFVIVKATSAEAMARACKEWVQIRPEFASSLQLVLRSNDVEFGAGTSRNDVAKKVTVHRRDKDCALLAPQLNLSGYNNYFLEKAR